MISFSAADYGIHRPAAPPPKKDVIELEAKFQLAVDLVQEIDLRFEELWLGHALDLPASSGLRIVQAR